MFAHMLQEALKRDEISRSSLLFEHDLRANAFRLCREGKPASTHRVVARGHAFPDHALDWCQHASQKLLRPRMSRRGQHLACRTFLKNLAVVEEQHAVRDLLREADLMGDDEH